ncbi:PREDICTED: uncharacterized protein LOC105567737 [Vollenhovia emeryi]|uniref:uncharacterized protein LOC105567737 n=1 Tax=Vollenhovia emeryi TaxID=411798 RepID=UPI0005F457DD|nr:PREDICTED: uncharacterized protein LOC105567737 [Vollenhovia emeryi]XP_011878231.1 PREDICTED: uncharacterized protein LOC105567737 [Vollenhovia emeryi]
MPIIGCTKENNCKRDAFLKARLLEAERTAGNPHKQGGSTETKKISETTVLSGVDVAPDLPENPDDIARHASGNKHLDERAAALEEPVAVARQDPVEIPQATTTVPETLVQTRQADVRELFVDGQETRAKSQRPPREIPDSEFR